MTNGRVTSTNSLYGNGAPYGKPEPGMERGLEPARVLCVTGGLPLDEWRKPIRKTPWFSDAKSSSARKK